MIQSPSCSVTLIVHSNANKLENMCRDDFTITRAIERQYWRESNIEHGNGELRQTLTQIKRHTRSKFENAGTTKFVCVCVSECVRLCEPSNLSLWCFIRVRFLQNGTGRDFCATVLMEQTTTTTAARHWQRRRHRIGNVSFKCIGRRVALAMQAAAAADSPKANSVQRGGTDSAFVRHGHRGHRHQPTNERGSAWKAQQQHKLAASVQSAPRKLACGSLETAKRHSDSVRNTDTRAGAVAVAARCAKVSLWLHNISVGAGSERRLRAGARQWTGPNCRGPA